MMTNCLLFAAFCCYLACEKLAVLRLPFFAKSKGASFYLTFSYAIAVKDIIDIRATPILKIEIGWIFRNKTLWENSVSGSSSTTKTKQQV